MNRITLPVSCPDLSARERAYLLEAFDSTWISSKGPFVERFEAAFADFAGVRHAITCCNGTAALHLALLGLNIGEGDEVIVPDLTYVATANAVRYVGAEPVLADCDPATWTIDPASTERLITPRTRAIIPVHLHGFPCDMSAIGALARAHGLHLIEDAAEAHGARYENRPVGSLGDAATFSFYGNKILSTGEGGMVCTSRDDVADRIRSARGQGVHPEIPYWFDTVGHNYRMTNVACAIGLAQLERFEEFRCRREDIAGWYDRAIASAALPLKRQQAVSASKSVLWMYGVALDEDLSVSRDEVRRQLASAGIETRPFFYPLHTLPIYRDVRHDGGCTVAATIARRGIMLPTHTRMTQDEVHRVVETLSAALRQMAGAT